VQHQSKTPRSIEAKKTIQLHQSKDTEISRGVTVLEKPSSEQASHRFNKNDEHIVEFLNKTHSVHSYNIMKTRHNVPREES
jgi:hypothetical protein